MKNTLFTLAVLVITFINAVVFSQNKTHQNDGTQYFYSSSNGDAGNPGLTSTPNTASTDPAKEQLIQQLSTARTNNDVSKAKELQNKLDELNGEKPVNFVNDPSKTGLGQTEQKFSQDELDGISTIGSAGYWAIATQTSNRSNLIFAAVSEYVSTSSDQLKVYASYDNGVSWVLKGAYTSFLSGVRLYNDELDIEPLITQNDTMLFVVAGYVYNGNRFTAIARFNIRTGSVAIQTFSLSAFSTRNYGPRLTSDNTYYGSLPYIYVTVANDTLKGANNHSIRQRLCRISNPLEPVFTQTHRISNPSQGGFHWALNNAADTIWMWQDIGYYRNNTSNDVLYSSCIFRGWNNVYNAWSYDYGNSVVSSLIIQEFNPISKLRLAFNGGTNQTGSITYLRSYTLNPNGDVDVRNQNTITGGTSVSSFIPGYVEFTSDTAISCDIQAIKGANNKFKFAFSIKGNKCYYLSNITQNLFTQPQLVNNLPAGGDFGRVRAGYRITATDSCLAVWSSNTGGGMYSTYGCDNLTGVSQNTGTGAPREYSLSQNYPNPFNPSTTIKFSIPQQSIVKLAVYDITGKEVAEIINKNLQAGSYDISFNASHLASGVYFYRIDAGEFNEVKKMMLIK